MTTIEQIENDALVLPKRARLRLAAKLLTSVSVDYGMDEDEDSSLRVAEERARELDGGLVQALDYKAEMQRIKDSLK